MATNVTMNRRVHAEGRLGLQLHYTSKGDLPAPRGFGKRPLQRSLQTKAVAVRLHVGSSGAQRQKLAHRWNRPGVAGS